MTSVIHFLFPINGDCLDPRDGEIISHGLKTTVRVAAPKGHAVYINNVLAAEQGAEYTAAVSLYGYRTTLVAEDRTTGDACSIAVFYTPEPEKKFRISSDDNILFLQDLTENQDRYSSIFDNPYLAAYKNLHDLYGACVHLNLFYEFPADHPRFSGKHTDFNLSMMTDRYRDEWQKNADWLKLSFHARREYPAKPYQFADAAQIIADCEDVHREILRFAGREVLPDVTTVHWGETTLACARALRTIGYKMLTGYFERTPEGEPLVSYYIKDELLDHIGERDFWIDTQEDIQFGRIDLVLNVRSHEQNMKELEKIVAHPHRSGFVSLMIHEQYFHADYTSYLPDFEKRLLEPCRYLWEHGYTGANIADVLQEKPLKDRI